MSPTAIQSPARAYGSAADMSQRAPFVDAATSIDPTHHHNIFLSYYTWGAAIGAGLDLTLRTRFDHTLDEWLRVLWRDYGSQQTAALAPARPYTLADLRTSLGAVTGERGISGRTWRDSMKVGAGAAKGRFLATIVKTILAAVVGLILCIAVAWP